MKLMVAVGMGLPEYMLADGETRTSRRAPISSYRR